MMISSLVSRNKRWIFEGSHLLGFHFKILRIFRSFSSIHRLFVFVELRWASCNEKRRSLGDYLSLIRRFEQERSTQSLMLLVSFETENKSVFWSPSSSNCDLASILLLLASLKSSVIVPNDLVLELQRSWFSDEDSSSNLWELRSNCSNFGLILILEN